VSLLLGKSEDFHGFFDGFSCFWICLHGGWVSSELAAFEAFGDDGVVGAEGADVVIFDDFASFRIFQRLCDWVAIAANGSGGA